jgi:hypothetical protein
MSPQTNAWRDLPKSYGPLPMETGTQPGAASVLASLPWARLDFLLGFRRIALPPSASAGRLGRQWPSAATPWLLHYSWFVDLINELLDDQPSKPLEAERSARRRGAARPHRWFGHASARLFEDQAATTLDG